VHQHCSCEEHPWGRHEYCSVSHQPGTHKAAAQALDCPCIEQPPLCGSSILTLHLSPGLTLGQPVEHTPAMAISLSHSDYRFYISCSIQHARPVMQITKGKVPLVCDRITIQSKAILNYIKINMSCKWQFIVIYFIYYHKRMYTSKVYMCKVTWH